MNLFIVDFHAQPTLSCDMLDCLLYRADRNDRPVYYRIEIAMTLFADVSVLCEWGVAGGRPRRMLSHYGNLREASLAADTARQNALGRGYERASC